MPTSTARLARRWALHGAIFVVLFSPIQRHDAAAITNADSTELMPWAVGLEFVKQGASSEGREQLHRNGPYTALDRHVRALSSRKVNPH
jgi:hypothetical protein